MDGFASDVASWQSAYVLIGGMAATLTGLLFVAVSINLTTVMGRDNPQLRQSAIRTFNQFILIVELSIVFQIPGQTPQSLGASILILALLALAITHLTTRDSTRGRQASQWTSAASYALFLAFAVVGILIITDQFELLFVMISLVMAALISSVFSAWSLLVEVGEDEPHRTGG